MNSSSFHSVSATFLCHPQFAEIHNTSTSSQKMQCIDTIQPIHIQPIIEQLSKTALFEDSVNAKERGCSLDSIPREIKTHIFSYVPTGNFLRISKEYSQYKEMYLRSGTVFQRIIQRRVKDICSLPIESIADLKKIGPIVTNLNLSDLDITDDDIKNSMEFFPQLKTLLLRNNHRLTGEIGPYLPNSILHIDISELYIQDSDFEKIAKYIPNIHSLILHNNNRLTSAIGQSLENLTQLRYLDVSSSFSIFRNTVEIGPCFSKLTHLQHLNLCECITLESNIGPYLAPLTQLQYLNLCCCTNITNEIGPYIEKLTHLQYLILECCKEIDDNMGRHIEMLPQLQYLNLSKCIKITNNIAQYFEKLTRLQYMDLSWCSDISHDICYYLDKLPKLQYVDFSCCYNIANSLVRHYFTNILLMKCRAFLNQITYI